MARIVVGGGGSGSGGSVSLDWLNASSATTQSVAQDATVSVDSWTVDGSGGDSITLDANGTTWHLTAGVYRFDPIAWFDDEGGATGVRFVITGGLLNDVNALSAPDGFGNYIGSRTYVRVVDGTATVAISVTGGSTDAVLAGAGVAIVRLGDAAPENA